MFSFFQSVFIQKKADWTAFRREVAAQYHLSEAEFQEMQENNEAWSVLCSCSS